MQVKLEAYSIKLKASYNYVAIFIACPSPLSLLLETEYEHFPGTFYLFPFS